ncbi:MAG: hypothetical protein KGO50_14350 [Myxococcales bacterium]|nr:hypothetical protein [Myxococcales bacterium]
MSSQPSSARVRTASRIMMLSLTALALWTIYGTLVGVWRGLTADEEQRPRVEDAARPD